MKFALSISEIIIFWLIENVGVSSTMWGLVNQMIKKIDIIISSCFNFHCKYMAIQRLKRNCEPLHNVYVQFIANETSIGFYVKWECYNAVWELEIYLTT